MYTLCKDEAKCIDHTLCGSYSFYCLVFSRLFLPLSRRSPKVAWLFHGKKVKEGMDSSHTVMHSLDYLGGKKTRII